MTLEISLAAYADALRASPHNLMSPRGLAELEARHLPECRSLAESLPGEEGRPARLLDVGSGGGLPGIVIAITRPDLEVHLLEARAKKVEFLRETVTALDLPVTVHHGRAEELARGGLGASFDLVTARAVAPLHRLLEWTMPFLTVGGLLYAVKGERWAEEVQEASGALRRLGGSLVSTPSPQATGSEPRSVIVRRVATIER